MNKKLTVLLVLVVAILAIVITSVAFAGPPQRLDSVAVCHFPGHITDFDIEKQLGGLSCGDQGGHALSLFAAAACKGHGVC